MEQSSRHPAKTLPQPARNAAEELLGRALGDDEEVSVRAYQPPEAPPPTHQREFAEALEALFATVDAQTKDIPAAERDELIDEAIRSVRPGYRPVQ